jgi:uncharacterized protein YjbI with pentapeptide repeats
MTAVDEENPATGARTITKRPLPALIIWFRGLNWQLFFQGVTAIAIPLSVLALFVSINEFKSQQKATADQVVNQQRQDTLANYLNDISALVLNYDLLKSKPGSAVRALAVARTDTAVRNLDGARKGILIRYLWEAGLIQARNPIVGLNKVNLEDGVFRGSYLYAANLATDNLIKANFYRTDAHGTILSWANLSGADLNKANLGCFTIPQWNISLRLLDLLRFSSIDCAVLRRADLTGAKLQDANLTGANLSWASLAGAHLAGAIYNAKPIPLKSTDGDRIILPATRWPQGFNPVTAGAHCIDCSTGAAGLG